MQIRNLRFLPILDGLCPDVFVGRGQVGGYAEADAGGKGIQGGFYKLSIAIGRFDEELGLLKAAG